MRFRWMVLLSLWILLSGPAFAPPAAGMNASRTGPAVDGATDAAPVRATMPRPRR